MPHRDIESLVFDYNVILMQACSMVHAHGLPVYFSTLIGV